MAYNNDDILAARLHSIDIPNNSLIPVFFQEEWSQHPGNHLDKARSLLLNFSQIASLEVAISRQLQAVIYTTIYEDVIQLAQAIRIRIFRNAPVHSPKISPLLLEATRFILTNTEYGHRHPDLTKEVIDYFFNPLEQHNANRKPNLQHYNPNTPFRVIIVGGGPAGLTAAIALAERAGDSVDIHVYEKRCEEINGEPCFAYRPNDRRRRGQVVTLQDDVTRLLSKTTNHALFGKHQERVWPSSANLQIREIEDNLLRRAQDTRLKNIIHIHSEDLDEQGLHNLGDFHMLLGADGANSWVRRVYFSDEDAERGRSLALGLGIHRPGRLPYHQGLNIILNLAQTRYLLNASNGNDSDCIGKGYLNIHLTEHEWNQTTGKGGGDCEFGDPCFLLGQRVFPRGFQEEQLFQPSMDPKNQLWRVVQDGLRLYGFTEHDVADVIRIPIVVRGVKNAVMAVSRGENSRLCRPRFLATLVGDAAMAVHFWPGRGMNSGIKSALAWADEVVGSLSKKALVDLEPEALQGYNDFVQKLMRREHDERSLRIVEQSGDPAKLGSLLYEDRPLSFNKRELRRGMMRNVWGAYKRIRPTMKDTLPPRKQVRKEAYHILKGISPDTIFEMIQTGPWPSMGGKEVLPPTRTGKRKIDDYEAEDSMFAPTRCPRNR